MSENHLPGSLSAMGRGLPRLFPFRVLFAFVLLSVSLSLAFAAGGSSPDKMILAGYPITIEFQKEDVKVAKEVARICERKLPSITSEIGLKSISPIRIILLDKVDDYRKSSGIDLPRWGAAFALVDRQLMLIDVDKAVAAWDALGKTIPHELSHLVLAQKVGSIPLPLWFVEGMAVWQAREWSLAESWHLMNAVWTGKAMGLKTLNHAFPSDGNSARSAYRVSYMAFLEVFSGAQVEGELRVFLDLVRRGGGFEFALKAFRGESLPGFARRFDKKLQEKYTSHLLLFQTGPLLSLTALLFLLVVLIVKLRSRKKLKELERKDLGLSLDD